MATPTMNFVGVTYINTASLGVGRYVADGEKWGGALGTVATLTYSFPTGTAYRDPNYSGNEWSSWFSLASLERSAVVAALATWSRFANVSFVQSADNSTTVGELRFAYSNTLTSSEAAHAYLPISYPEAGDVWFNPDYFNQDGGGIPVGSYDFLTIIHEIGHALGLKHTFDTPSIPAVQDNYFYSIMSYTASPYSAHGDNYASFYPTTPMYYDLLAMEGMYGQRAYNAGNNNYVFNDGVRYWQAINDTGGNDTIAYSGAENATINLNPGTFSSLSEGIRFQRPNGSFVTSKATVTIGPHVVIENARGGNGNDTLVGNATNNNLNGGNGNDVMGAAAGNDYMIGGSGNDRLLPGLGNDYLIGGPGNDIFVFNTALNALTNSDRVADYNVAQDTIQLENAIFTRLPTSAHMSTAYFRAAAHALDSNDFVIYNRATGALLYDPNGNGAGGEVQFALFVNKPVLTAAEFAVV
jgi:Ca2+-binding RTX toxin-like protein